SIAAQKFDYQFYTSFGLNLVNNENLGDRENTQQSKYDLEVAGEYYFLKKFQNLRFFSLEASIRRAHDAMKVGQYNAVSKETSIAAHFNWYPFYSPNTLDRNILYLGLLFRYGVSRLEIPSQGEEGNYNVMSL